MRRRLHRLVAGVGILAALLVALFAAVIPAIHRWGASNAELARALPGDELLPRPGVRWTHALTIDAPPAQVWPWIAQLGDTRGGFYSYTLIENRVGALTGSADYRVVYHNAEQIVPAWQHPAPGDVLIQGVLKVRELEPGVWLLADAVQPETFGWTWLWRLDPLDGGRQTRLVVRMRIQTAAALGPAALVMDAGGFMMEQRMLQGIKLRAEGGHEPGWMEGAELALWLVALLCGLIAAGLFVFRPAWQQPLAVAVAAVVALFILTFVQPQLWVRILIDALLLGGVWGSAVMSHSRLAAIKRRAAARERVATLID